MRQDAKRRFPASLAPTFSTRSLVRAAVRAILSLAATTMLFAAQSAVAQTPITNAGISDTGSALVDAILATPNPITPTVPDNDLATTPGLEGPASTPQFTLNFLGPALFNSNAQALSSGGAKTLELNPSFRLGWASQVLGSPVRVSSDVGFETDRYLNAASANINDVRPSLRAQYVNLNDDQDYSPFVSYTSEVDFDSASPYREQNLNLGVDKVFNFDSGFNRLPPSSDSSTRAAWSFGFSAVAQRRFTDPAPGSYALAVTPSAAYVVSDQWNISISAPITTRWYDVVGRLKRRTLALEPTGIVEYIIPAGWLGGDKIANRLGNPAIDFVVGETRQWSNASGGAYVQMTAGVALKTGWRF
jgi:hypothetical protein